MKKKVKFLTYQQQLDNLRDHGLIVTNDRIGIELLQSRGYYNLINRYKEDLYRKGRKEYPIQTTLEDLYKEVNELINESKHFFLAISNIAIS